MIKCSEDNFWDVKGEEDCVIWTKFGSNTNPKYRAELRHRRPPPPSHRQRAQVPHTLPHPYAKKLTMAMAASAAPFCLPRGPDTVVIPHFLAWSHSELPIQRQAIQATYLEDTVFQSAKKSRRLGMAASNLETPTSSSEQVSICVREEGFLYSNKLLPGPLRAFRLNTVLSMLVRH